MSCHIHEYRRSYAVGGSAWALGHRTPGPSGNCAFGSLVPLNGLGETNLWTPRIIQMALKFSF
jgi:hypothetical protein